MQQFTDASIFTKVGTKEITDAFSELKRIKATKGLPPSLLNQTNKSLTDLSSKTKDRYINRAKVLIEDVLQDCCCVALSLCVPYLPPPPPPPLPPPPPRLWGHEALCW
eukprot:3427834-Pyramimonas_sp.AAC.1